MKLLIVDDQREIVESLKDGIDWAGIGIEEVQTACSAREAKLIIKNINIDILLTDIEMPEEDGLELFQWTLTMKIDVVCIFLTSHVDFNYVREAIRMGGFDYILQPARYEEVRSTVGAAVERVKTKKRISKMEHTMKLIQNQRNELLELIFVKEKAGALDQVAMLWDKMKRTYYMDFTECQFWPLMIQIVHINKQSKDWNQSLIDLVFINVMEELMNNVSAKICITEIEKNNFLMLAGVEKGTLDVKEWEQIINEFFLFFEAHGPFQLAIFLMKDGIEEYTGGLLEAFAAKKAGNIPPRKGIFTEDAVDSSEDAIMQERIEMVKDYIRKNTSRVISRSEIAEQLHLNEEYFSRMFKKYTGYTFKDYEMMERINQAKQLLEFSHFSVSIIAYKVGYDNFSHFSKMFKKITGSTPMEYRKEKEQSKLEKS